MNYILHLVSTKQYMIYDLIYSTRKMIRDAAKHKRIRCAKLVRRRINTERDNMQQLIK